MAMATLGHGDGVLGAAIECQTQYYLKPKSWTVFPAMKRKTCFA